MLMQASVSGMDAKNAKELFLGTAKLRLVDLTEEEKDDLERLLQVICSDAVCSH
jgi:hypothetical protein